MFHLKLKGNPNLYYSDFVEMKVNGIRKWINTEEGIREIITKYDVGNIEILIDKKFRKIHNLYFKTMYMVWLVEGLDD